MTSESYPKQYLYKRIVESKLFIDAHYADPIDIGEIASHAYFSKFHFIRTFREIYGVTPHQYLSRVRIDRAKELLSRGATVTDACFAVGFESPGSFASLFKRMAGISPKTFRARHRLRVVSVSEAPLEHIPGCFSNNSNIQEAP